MDIINLAKILGAILCLGIAYMSYRTVRGKKPIIQGENKFFIENNGLDLTDYFSSWRLIIMCFLTAIALIFWVFE